MSVYLLYGEEKFLLNKYKEDLLKQISSEDDLMNLHKFEGKAKPIDIANAINTTSFIGETIVVVKDSGLFYKGRMEDSESIYKHIENMPSESFLIFIENKVDGRSKLFKLVKKIGNVKEFKTNDEKSIMLWIEKLLKQNNKYMDKKDIIYFLEVVSLDMTNISKELQKLISYKDDEIITKEDINNICIKTLESKIFDLIEHISNKSTKALKMYKDMIDMKESPLMILTMIGRQMKILLQCKVLKEQGKSVAEISKEIKLPTFVIKKTLMQSNKFTKVQLYNYYKKIQNRDIEIKTGKIKDDLGVQLILIEVMNL